MIRILLLGISALMLLSCDKSSNIRLSKINSDTSQFHQNFKQYCSLNENQKLAEESEENAVLSSFVGDYKSSLLFAEQDFNYDNENTAMIGISNKEILLNNINDSLLKTDYKYKQFIEALEYSDNPKALFGRYKKTEASSVILDKASNYHFLLINEAHYSGQHRAFTSSLLKPLWEKGYRYLALETLSHKDNEVNKRKYPVTETGYYSVETSFGNMIREALKIGYKLIPYETKVQNQDGNERDLSQAQNLFNTTYKIDTIGKVIVHAGYSHINEIGGPIFKPMGANLIDIANQEILTVEQQVMTGFLEKKKSNSLYSYVLDAYNLKEPSVFINEDMNVLVDPVNTYGIDIQIYHPITVFEHGRPNWLINDTNKLYELPKEIKEFTDHLVEIIPKNESDNAIPIDRFVINDETNAVILPKGEFFMNIFDCQGKVSASFEIKINT